MKTWEVWYETGALSPDSPSSPGLPGLYREGNGRTGPGAIGAEKRAWNALFNLSSKQRVRSVSAAGWTDRDKMPDVSLARPATTRSGPVLHTAQGEAGLFEQLIEKKG